jgi:hypothetical protein
MRARARTRREVRKAENERARHRADSMAGVITNLNAAAFRQRQAEEARRRQSLADNSTPASTAARGDET